MLIVYYLERQAALSAAMLSMCMITLPKIKEKAYLFEANI